jgi:hypothetical protein
MYSCPKRSICVISDIRFGTFILLYMY